MPRFLAPLFLVGCASAPSAVPADTLDGDGLDLRPVARAEGGYFQLEPDMRDCMSPVCGGWFVHKVNKSQTRCADGTLADACYVAEVDASRLGLDPTTEQAYLEALGTGHLLARGAVVSNEHPAFGELGLLRLTEAWVAGTDAAPRGSWARVTDTGVACFTFPCPIFHDAKLNTRWERDLAELDLTPSGATPTDVEAALAAAATADGLLVAGGTYDVTGPAGTMPGRFVTAFYTKLAP